MHAHAIKGAAATVAAGALSALARRLQEAGMAADRETSAHLLPGLEQRFEELKGVLERSGWA
jgi:HPt (histidine-containing phosphotransfer) domain-containing protein